jgi:nucleoid-associated protein YgaU
MRKDFLGAAVAAVSLIMLVGVYLLFFRGSDVPPPETPAAVTTPAQQAVIENPAIPTFDIVRVERDGSTVIAGRALPGAEITVLANGAEVARATADERGEWVVLLEKPLAPGDAELTLLAKNPDGNEQKSLQIVTVSIPTKKDELALVVISEPGKGSRMLQGPGVAAVSGSLVLEAVDYDEIGNVILSGRADAGASLRVYLSGKPVGDTVANKDGRWELRPKNPIVPGHYQLRVDQIDKTGKVVSRVEVPFERGNPADIIKALSEGKVVIQPGNNLWNISRRLYGSGFRYTVIYRANQEQIRDPNLIYPGQILNTPAQ